MSRSFRQMDPFYEGKLQGVTVRHALSRFRGVGFLKALTQYILQGTQFSPQKGHPQTYLSHEKNWLVNDLEFTTTCTSQCFGFWDPVFGRIRFASS